ncbi:MAG: DUF5107 domain-containing protein, partial [Ginsengibacter sp.]
MRVLLFSLVIFFSVSGFSQQNATVKEYQQAFTTYPFSDPNPIPSFTIIYPYFRFDGFTDKPEKKEWKVVALENDFIKLTILPEVGGKIWSAVEKKTGKPFVYENHVVKFRDIAMRGPWTSGGIEANYGTIGHTPNCATPVDYIARENSDGSASCFIGVLDLLTGTHWTVEINLPKDKAYFTTKSFWYNPTSVDQPYYSWMNAGFKTEGNLEYIYPGTHYFGHEGEYNDWPVNQQNGKAISFYDNNNFGGYKSYHVFGKYTNFFGGYWHKDGLGVARYSTRDDKAGKKIWIWGLSQQGMIWEKLLTDTDGQYTEMQSGRLFNQTAEKSSFTPFKHKNFSPYATDAWTEYWMPVLKTKGFVEANEYGALNFKNENGWLKIYFSAVQKIDDSLVVKDEDKIIYQKILRLQPLETFTDSIKINTNAQHLLFALGGNKLVHNTNPDVYNLSRPLDSPKKFDWESSYGLYVMGKELLDEKMYAAAEEKLIASLKKDENFLPALVKMSELMYRNGRWNDALSFAKKALSINTNDGASNYYYGLANEKLHNEFDAKDGFELAALSMEFRTSAYTELSKIYMQQKNWSKAIEYADKALDFNRYNIPALQNKAIALRKINVADAAKKILDIILLFDPLNHFAGFENYLWQPSEKNKENFTSMFRGEMINENYQQLGLIYFNNNCFDEAETVFQWAPGNLSRYWQAFIKYKRGDSFESDLSSAINMSPAFVFPYRTEDEEMLLWAIKNNNSWKPKYFLALLYKNENKITECNDLFNECGDRPNFAPFYAARAAVAGATSPLDDLEKALSLAKDDWRYNKLLSEYYLEKKQNKEALNIAGSFFKSHPKDYIMGM